MLRKKEGKSTASNKEFHVDRQLRGRDELPLNHMDGWLQSYIKMAKREQKLYVASRLKSKGKNMCCFKHYT